MNQHDPLFERDIQERREEAADRVLELKRRFNERYDAHADSQELIALMNEIKALERGDV